MSDFLLELAEKVTLREGPEGHRTILRQIYRAGHISLKDLARQCQMPLPVVASVVNYLVEKQILDRIPEGILYTEQGMQFVERTLHFMGIGIATCENCYGHPVYLSPRWDDLLEKMDTILEQRPQVDTTLDQSLADSETNVARALLLYENGAIEGKRVIFLGDDDFSSLAVGLLYLGITPEEPTLLANSLFVADIDQRILEKITQIAKAEDLSLSTVHWDYRQPVPQVLLNQFDTVVVDPPYSLNGAKLSLSRALSLLDAGIGKEIYFSFAHWPPESMVNLHQLFVESGVAVMEIMPHFNYYDGAEILGNETQLFRLVTTSKSHPLIEETATFTEKLYTDEMHPTIRFYYCTQCRKLIEVGSTSPIKTIENLKDIGCPYCHGHGPFQLDEKIDVPDTNEDVPEDSDELDE
jgi:predicted methyltransferase